MTDAITNKTNVLVSRLGDFWVTAEQGKKIMAIKEHDNSANIEIEGNHISCSSIDGVLTAEAYNIYNLKKRGGWQCKYQHWHERNQQCAHHLVGSQA